MKRNIQKRRFRVLAAAMAVILQFTGANCAVAKSDDLQANPVPAIGQNAKDQKVFDPAKKGPRVLFVGNSITLHGPRPQIGWTNNWGMAASARDKDYVHLLDTHGRFNHPGDLGMNLIAERFWQHIEQRIRK